MKSAQWLRLFRVKLEQSPALVELRSARSVSRSLVHEIHW